MMDMKEVLGEELYNQLMAKVGDKHKIAVVSDGSWIPKEKFNEANAAKKQAEDALKDRDKQLEDLKKTSGDSAALQEQITKLQGENKAAADKYTADLKDLQVSTALKLAIAGKVHDPDIVAGLLDKTKIELDDSGAVKGGLDDQVKALRESKGFLFVPETPGQQRFKGTNPLDGKDKGGNGGGEGSVGESFAKTANEIGKAPAAANNPWA